MRGLLHHVSPHFSVSQLFPRVRFEEVQYRLRNYYRRRQEECEDEIVLLNEENNSNTNKNFMKEKDIKFRLYPFYINWKKIEENEKGYYRTFIHYGFFGASIYSLFKEKYPEMDFKNIIYILSSFIYEYLVSGNDDDSSQDIIKYFFEKLPNLDEICGLIKKRIILMKEVPILLIVLKIYEIYFMRQKDKKNEIETVLKSEYLLGTYLTDDEFNKMYKKHFKGNIYKVFMKIVNNNGKEYAFPKTKDDFLVHIKY